jgi:capsular polysaccharide transport system permease protein
MSKLQPDEFREFQVVTPPRPLVGWGKQPWAANWRWRFKKTLGALSIWAWLVVVLPSALAGIYFFGIAADQYSSTTSFIVKRASEGSSGGGIIGTLLQSTGLVTSHDDTEVVLQYIKSRSALEELVKEHNFRAVVNRPSADFLAQFPRPWGSDSFESLYRRYDDFVSAHIDATTGSATLEVKAFQADDAHNIAQALLEDSERLINRMNARARTDAIQSAQQEVAMAEARLSRVQGTLTEYRLSKGLLDPKDSSKGVFTVVGQLTAARAKAKAELATLLESSPRSPQLAPLRDKISALSDQIDEETSHLVGGKDSIVKKLSRYEDLKLQQELAAKALASATASLGVARSQAIRQQLYLEPISLPSVSDMPLYPKRFFDFFTVVFTALLSYWILRFVVLSIKEHRAG